MAHDWRRIGARDSGEKAPETKVEIEEGRVYISKTAPRLKKRGQYFEGVSPEVWNFHLNGYQVCHKWLKDRRGRALTLDEIERYEKIVKAISETIRVMDVTEGGPGAGTLQLTVFGVPFVPGGVAAFPPEWVASGQIKIH